jgi:hypothetical protein
MNQKIIIIGVIFLIMVVIGSLLLLKPKKCPSDKPYLQNGTCVASCSSGKRDGSKCLTATENCPSSRSKLSDGVCVASCPSDNPSVVNGVCSPCSSNTDGNIYNDNGVCVASCQSLKRDGNNCVTACPTDKPYLENSVCVASCPFYKRNIDGLCVDIPLNSSNSSFNVNDILRSSSYSYDGNNNTFWAPSQGTNSWWILLPQDPTKIYNSYEIIFRRRTELASANDTTTITIYKNINPEESISPTFNASGHRTVDLSNLTPEVTRSSSSTLIVTETLTGNFNEPLTNVRNFLVHFSHRIYLYEVKFM